MRAFISYSHHDAAALDRLHVHLANLQREGRIAAWYDREILAGDVLDEEISAELEAADLVLLLISPDFIASDYCVEREMRRALDRHDAGETWVVPIIVEPCDWAAMPQLRRLKAVPRDGRPISDWANANKAYLDVVQELRRIIDAGAGGRRRAGLATRRQGSPRYRIEREFDEIDRGEYRDAAFAAIKDHFRRSIGEIDAMDGLRGRFVDRGAGAFGGTLVNRARRGGAASISVRCRDAGVALADISFTFGEDNADAAANGGFNVASDAYEQFLVASLALPEDGSDRLSPEQAAEVLWGQFIEQAGITRA
ncbi:MAG: toll/interleukin-1 receptor domain-containing protein [Pseudomonadota bacterium]